MSSNAPSEPGPVPSSPPEAWESLARFTRFATRALDRFLHIEAASGVLLLVAAAVALAWANSPWADSYHRLWEMPVGVSVGALRFERPLVWFVNDVLMVLFFFVVGMEIRREVDHGELSEWRRAALPASIALGAMLVPAALYLIIAGAPETRSGWGVPMATDIAFAVGVLTLLGTRVPAALRILLLSMAVIDDLGAIIVIALFYSSGISLAGLMLAALGVVGVFAMQRLGVRRKLAYVAPAFVVWAGVYLAGVHPTIAGVMVGFMTPVRPWLGLAGFLRSLRDALDRLAHTSAGTLPPQELAQTLRHVDVARREAMSPAESLIEALHPWVAFGIMPLFALANAGVTLAGGPLDESSWRVAAAVAIGLVVGKPAGVLAISWLALRLGIGTLPAGLSFRHLSVLGVVAGVGFTMALFVAQLAFTDEELLSAAKLGVLVASTGAAVLGLVLGRLLLSPATDRDVMRETHEGASARASALSS